LIAQFTFLCTDKSMAERIVDSFNTCMFLLMNKCEFMKFVCFVGCIQLLCKCFLLQIDL